jgi:16S rRNA (cytosine1402-N4)-methyltransferase
MAAFVRGLGEVTHERLHAFPCCLNEVVDALQPRDGGRYVDGTFGGGGYTTRDARSRACEVIAIDRDPEPIAAGQALAARYAPRLR